MAVNQLSSLLDMEIPVPKRSNFYRGYINRFTASMGYGYPAGVWEILPNTRCRMDVSALLKSDPLNSSLFGTIRQSMQAYFVPSRLYVKELDQNFRNGITNDELENVKFPTFGSDIVKSSDYQYNKTLWRRTPFNSSLGNDLYNFYGVVPAGSLLDMLGMYPSEYSVADSYLRDESSVAVSSASPVNAIPLVGYYDIYRNYYINLQQTSDVNIYNERTDSFSVSSFPFWDSLINSVYERKGNENFSLVSESAGWNILLNDDWREFTRRYLNSAPTEQILGSMSNPDVVNNVHAGYWLRTYDDDFFTSRLDSSYVEQLDTTSRVVVDTDRTFSVSQMRLANRNYRYTSRNLLANSQRYDDWLSVHYGAKLNRALNIPQFLGSISSEFTFDDIYATASTSTTENNGQVGDRASVLNTSLQGRHFVDFEAEEHGYLILIYSLIPRIDYFGTTHPMYFKTSMADVYKPEYDAIGYQPLTNGVLSGPQLPQYDKELAHQVSWFEYMVDWNKVHGRFTLSEANYTTLSLNLGEVGKLSKWDDEINTYIIPPYFSQIFQETAYWKDNFYVQLNMQLKCYQPMSKQIISLT